MPPAASKDPTDLVTQLLTHKGAIRVSELARRIKSHPHIEGGLSFGAIFGLCHSAWVFIFMNDASTRLLYDRREAARQLSISVRSLDYIIASKGLDTRRIGKKVLVTHASLVRYASANHFGAITSRSDAEAVASGERCA
jgi:hypothetical protein